MTLQEMHLLAEMAPSIKDSLEMLITDAIIRNDTVKPDDYSPELQLAISCREFLREVVSA
jgi:hypothetical protein